MTHTPMTPERALAIVMRNRLTSKSQQKALAELKRIHLDEYQELYAKHRKIIFKENGIEE